MQQLPLPGPAPRTTLTLARPSRLGRTSTSTPLEGGRHDAVGWQVVVWHVVACRVVCQDGLPCPAGRRAGGAVRGYLVWRRIEPPRVHTDATPGGDRGPNGPHTAPSRAQKLPPPDRLPPSLALQTSRGSATSSSSSSRQRSVVPTVAGACRAGCRPQTQHPAPAAGLGGAAPGGSAG